MSRTSETAPDIRHWAPNQPFEGRGSNAELRPEPVPASADRWVTFDFPGVAVGSAEYPLGPTGCTVVAFDEPVRTAVDIRGGSPGITGAFDVNDAICLAGGSSYGLQAASGVAGALLQRRDNDVGWQRLASVSGAIIYDYRARDTAVFPDVALGAAALNWAEASRIPVGRTGAGISATVGKLVEDRAEYAGQGAAFTTVGETRLMVLTVVNAVGVVLDRRGEVVRGNLDPASGTRSTYAPLDLVGPVVQGNTTLTVLVTDARFTADELRQVARMVHGSMHRAISPFHTETDGDIFFAATTGRSTWPGNATTLGMIASDLAWDAVLNSCDD